MGRSMNRNRKKPKLEQKTEAEAEADGHSSHAPTAGVHSTEFSECRRDDEISEDTQEDSTHDEYDRDSSISFDDDEDSTASHEDDLGDWIEFRKWAPKKLMNKC